jgi:protein-S-isoprenylcysteine O-methyltransferase Ste14
MKDRLIEQTRHEYSEKQRIVALAFMAPVFLLALPYIFVKLGFRLDLLLNWPHIVFGLFNLILACLLIVAGLGFAMWSIVSQFTLGRGTPVPLMATQRLIVQPPYTYCRNPMALGTFAAYLGAAVYFGSIGAVIVVLLFAAALLIYIWRVEEKEMEIRFGQEYLRYRDDTPFIFPRLH